MAKKAKIEQKKAASTIPSAVRKEESIAVQLLKSGLLTLSLALGCFSIQLALRPLYGATPSSLKHPYIKMIASLLSVTIPSGFPGKSEQGVLVTLAVWLAYAPYSTYAFAKWSAKWGNPVLGASATEALIIFPMIAVGVSLLRQWNAKSIPFLPGPFSAKTASALGVFKLVDVTEKWLLARLPQGGLVYSSNLFFLASACLTVCAIMSSSLDDTVRRGRGRYSYGRLLPLVLPALTAAVSLSLPPTATVGFPYVHGNLTKGAPVSVRVLARAYSVTGLILVAEHVEEQFRFLRADHSILGGRWIGKKVPPATQGIGDSIYSTFVLQEAVRLVQRPQDHTGQPSALFIGLGVGVAAQSFISHGINTTIVEIDPFVYQYAREYFNLPEPNAIYLEDVRNWLQRPTEKDKFDYVIHDCFSGGGVPQDIYTVEFWESLKRIMKPDGVIAVNFAGRLATEPARAIILTLQHSFANCRAYHDHQEAEFDESYTFFNIVFFCTLSADVPLNFRPAASSDYQGSYLRAHIFNDLPKRELSARKILGVDQDSNLLAEGVKKWILRDTSNRLAEWEQADAVEHWTVMRGVLPDVFWETY